MRRTITKDWASSFQTDSDESPCFGIRVVTRWSVYITYSTSTPTPSGGHGETGNLAVKKRVRTDISPGSLLVSARSRTGWHDEPIRGTEWDTHRTITRTIQVQVSVPKRMPVLVVAVEGHVLTVCFKQWPDIPRIIRINNRDWKVLA